MPYLSPAAAAAAALAEPPADRTAALLDSFAKIAFLSAPVAARAFWGDQSPRSLRAGRRALDSLRTHGCLQRARIASGFGFLSTTAGFVLSFLLATL